MGSGHHHPLAPLPTRLLPLERHLPRFLGRRSDPDADDWTYPAERRPLGELISGFGRRAPVDRQHVTAAVRDWPPLSNGSLRVDSWWPGSLDRPADLPGNDEGPSPA